MNDNEKNQEQVYGKIIKGGFILRQYIGEATTPDGKKFELATTMNNSPMVLYRNKVYVLSWNDICNMASDAGLFENNGSDDT